MDTEYLEIDPEEFDENRKDFKKSALLKFKIGNEEDFPPIRDRVFNSELKDLASSIMHHTEGSESELKIKSDSGARQKKSAEISEEYNYSQSDSDDGIQEQEIIEDDSDFLFDDTASLQDSESIVDDSVEEIEKDQKENIFNSEVYETESDDAVYDSINHEPPDNTSVISSIYPIEQENLDTENLDTENLDTENLDTENLDTENLDTENLDTENLDTEIITVDLNNQMTFSDIPLPEKLMIALLENFRKQDSKEIDFTEILHYFQKESNTSSFVVMAEDQMYNVYRILTGRGLDPITQKNLYFSNRDIYLNNNEDYEILKFKGVIKEDFNFKKRFSSDFLSKHNGAFCINLYKFNFSGWIIFFYRNFDSIDIEHIYSKVENVISDFVPLFERYRMEQFPRKPFSEFNLYDQIAFCLYRMSAKATESVNIIYLTLNEFSHEVSYADFDRKWNDHLFSLMSSGDKLVRNGPDRWIILSKKLRTDQVMDHVNQFCSKCGISVTYRNIIYPDNGINVLNYMFTGPQKRMH